MVDDDGEREREFRPSRQAVDVVRHGAAAEMARQRLKRAKTGAPRLSVADKDAQVGAAGGSKAFRLDRLQARGRCGLVGARTFRRRCAATASTASLASARFGRHSPPF